MGNKVYKLGFAIIASALFLWGTSIIVSAMEKIPEQKSSIYVNDFANVLTSDAKTDMIKLAEKFDDVNNIQVVVTTIGAHGDTTLRAFGQEMFKKWEIGREDKKGVLIIYSKAKKEFEVILGDGLKYLMSDATAQSFANGQASFYIRQNLISNGIAYCQMSIIDKLESKLQYNYTANNENGLIDSTENIEDIYDDGSDMESIMAKGTEMLFGIIFVGLFGFVVITALKDKKR